MDTWVISKNSVRLFQDWGKWCGESQVCCRVASEFQGLGLKGKVYPGSLGLLTKCRPRGAGKRTVMQ